MLVVNFSILLPRPYIFLRSVIGEVIAFNFAIMATNVSKTHLFRTLNKRRFASAAAQHATGYYSNDVEIDHLPNKLTVASVDSSLPLSRFSVIIKAGSRYDPSDAPGLNHVLRSSAGLTTSNSTVFGITRNVQQIGANIQVTGNRDTITYTLEATCDQLNKGLRFLKDIVVSQVFKPWELEDNIPRIKYELAILPPQAKLVDVLHKAAYRTGLGNALLVKDFNIGKIGSETLQHHVSSLFTSQRSAVVGVGVGHDTVINFASDLELPVGTGPEVPPTYYGGEVSEEAPTNLTHTGLAIKAAGLKDKDLLAFAVLRYVLGGWSTIKWTPGNSPLSKAVRKVDESANVSAFNAVHADSGLFGIIVTASSSKAKSALFAAAEVLNQNVTADAVARAKNQLKTDVLHAIQNGEELAADIASQVLLKGCYTNSCSLSDEIDNVSESDVSNALKKFKTSKKALATYGNLSDVPYLDEFK